MADAAQLAAIASSSADQKTKQEQYKAAQQRVIESGSVDACKAFADHMLSDDVPLVISRQVLSSFAHDVAHLPGDAHKAVATYMLEKIQPRVVSFEAEVALLREGLAEQLERDEEWSKAAQTLAGIDLDSGMRVLEPAYKLAKNIKIAMLYLEDDDSVSAEQYIKKASALLGACQDEELELQYKSCYARIVDAKRRFLDAALRYYELSNIGGKVIGGKMTDAEDLEQALRAAITCAILAPAGPQRSRMLAALCKDERSSQLPVYPFLEKVYLERILRRDEVLAFAETLREHQKAQLPDGSTVLERSVMQHNMLSASKLYNNINIQELGTLLGVEPEKAELMAADMIREERLRGSIDQVQNMIHFDAEEPLAQWDIQIQSVCNRVNDIIDNMSRAGLA